MYITENQSLGESVLFLLSARNTLAEMVEDAGHESSEEMINFLINEASDYEIISLLVEGVIPEEKYNEDHEAWLFSSLKEQVLANHELVSEMVGSRTFSDFMTKVDSVYPVVSTAGPMLEFFSKQDASIAGAMLLSEQGVGSPEWMRMMAKKKAAVGAKAASKKNLMGADKAPEGPIAKPDLGKPSEYGGITQGKGATAKGAFKAQAKRDIEAKKLTAQDRPDTGPGPAGMKQSELDKMEPGFLMKLKASLNSAADSVSAFAKTPAGLAVGGAALAALLGYAAAKTYKRFFSKAAGACRGMSGGAKTDCMNKFRGRALMAQAADLQRGMASCSKAKNPAACKSAVGGKIERLKARARKISG